MKIDRSWLLAHRSQKGGWNAHQLQALGMEWPPQRGWINRVCEAEYSQAQIDLFLKNGLNGIPTRPEKKRIKREAQRLRRRQLREKRFARKDSFLESYEWRKVRMQVLTRDGARCACCGATRQDGRQMHVDHIKPRKLHPELALDPKNLQVLCDVCNHGKGNWDQTDWRDDFTEDAIGAKLRLVK